MVDMINDLFYECFLLVSLVYKNTETDAFLWVKRKSILCMARFWMFCLFYKLSEMQDICVSN